MSTHYNVKPLLTISLVWNRQKVYSGNFFHYSQPPAVTASYF